MAINLAPWKYRDLLIPNDIIDPPDFYEVLMINSEQVFESNVKLKDFLRPNWLNKSSLYKDADGSGTDKFKNIAVYKAISESLERLAFYELCDTKPKDYAFDVNPTTTGLAAYPGFLCSQARKNAIIEASERWAIHAFNYSQLPVLEHSNAIKNLSWYEVVIPFKNIKVSILKFNSGHFYCYGFAAGSNLKHSYEKAFIELDRNYRILMKSGRTEFVLDSFSSTTDRTLAYFANETGHTKFSELIAKSPKFISISMPQILCDRELLGSWSKYSKVWRFLYEHSYAEKSNDPTFFMF